MRITAGGVDKKALKKRFLQGLFVSTSNIIDIEK